uniref:Uncharacterized protein n=1 Tax=Lactuca sativa TaxID=4236 RepID=A0A9R1VCD5_LACSA|nr:hypothetical protein LSAT_V11C500275420 [Lactuca sativa]
MIAPNPIQYYHPIIKNHTIILFYVGDAIFIGEWNSHNLRNLVRILKCFRVASGLKVNFNKLRVFGIFRLKDVLEPYFVDMVNFLSFTWLLSSTLAALTPKVLVHVIRTEGQGTIF